MSVRPLILIDFDGVFNLTGGSLGEAGEWQDATDFVIPVDKGGLVINIKARISRALIEFFNAIARSEQVEIIWVTTWTSNTLLFPQHLGFEPMGWQERPARKDTGTQWWKLDAAKDLAGDGDNARPTLWIDDDIQLFQNALSWIDRTNHVSAISPVKSKGITPTEVEVIRSFVQEHTGVSIN